MNSYNHTQVKDTTVSLNKDKDGIYRLYVSTSNDGIAFYFSPKGAKTMAYAIRNPYFYGEYKLYNMLTFLKLEHGLRLVRTVESADSGVCKISNAEIVDLNKDLMNWVADNILKMEGIK